MFWWVWICSDAEGLAQSCGYSSKAAVSKRDGNFAKNAGFLCSLERDMHREETGVVLYFSNALSFLSVF